MSSFALAIDTFNVKYFFVLTQYYKIDLKIAITFLSKINKLIDVQIPFLSNFVRPKTSDKDFKWQNSTMSIVSTCS